MFFNSHKRLDREPTTPLPAYRAKRPLDLQHDNVTTVILLLFLQLNLPILDQNLFTRLKLEKLLQVMLRGFQLQIDRGSEGLQGDGYLDLASMAEHILALISGHLRA